MRLLVNAHPEDKVQSYCNGFICLSMNKTQNCISDVDHILTQHMCLGPT